MMKRIVIFAAVIAGGFAGYQYWSTGDVNLASFAFWNKGEKISAPPTKDKQGNPLVPCPKCSATGQVACTAPRCKSGKVPCPGKCLKESDFKEHWPEPVAGHAPDELWAVFRFPGGKQGLAKNHIGEVAGVRDGKFYREGACKVCNGRSVLDCKVCSGTGLVTCPLCQGTKAVATTRKASPAASQKAAATPPPAPLKATGVTQPARPKNTGPIKLKNGKTIHGSIVVQDDSITWIRTDDGKRIEVKSSEILSH